MNVLPFMIGNTWRTGGGQAFASIDPSTGKAVVQIGSATSDDVDAAVTAARAALSNPDWSRLKFHERAHFLYKISDLMFAEIDHLAQVQMEDNGKTLAECRGQAMSAASTFRYYGAVCETFESEVNTQRGPSMTMTVYEPVGVIAAITPWNSPLTLEAQKLAPILAAGNTVVLKPSEVTSRIALEYARLAIKAGLPPGVLNVVTGHADIGRALVDHVDVDMVSFTGGTASGRAIAQACGARLRPVVLELGGKSPHIVFADADLERARKVVADGIFSGGGQSCVAGSRIFVEASVHDAFLKAICDQAGEFRMGAPNDVAVTMGPMVSFQHRDHVETAVEAARAEGAKVLTGGSVPSQGELTNGAYYPATVVSGVTNQSRVAQQEIFGPVAVVIPFTDEEDLVKQANDTEFGLAAGVWTADFGKAWRVARAIRAGTVWINTYKETSISTPFGGFKQSGLGREKGRNGVRTYMEPKGIYWHMG